ncbi:MAG: hypothetical protein QM704_16665 [Anaeromyxobacteraceae bacterium]
MSGTSIAKKLVGEPLVRHREDAGVREDRLVAGLERGVALVGGLDVGGREAPHVGQAGEEGARRAGRELGAVTAGVRVVPLGEGDAAADLRLERAQRAGERRADEVVEALVVEVARAEVAREQHGAEVLDHADHRVPRGQRHAAVGGEAGQPGRLAAQRLDDRRERPLLDALLLLGHAVLHGGLVPRLRPAARADARDERTRPRPAAPDR